MFLDVSFITMSHIASDNAVIISLCKLIPIVAILMNHEKAHIL